MIRRTVPVAAAALVVAATLAACAAQSPEERVIALRAEYDVKLNSFQVIDQPVAPPPATAPVEEAAAGPPGAEPVAGDAEPVAGDDEPVPPVGDAGQAEDEAALSEPLAPAPDVRQDVLLDIVVHNRSDERLPGLTLDVEQADAQFEPKTSYRIWVDTSNISPGSQSAISHRLEDVEFVEGDVFSVELRQAIPPEQRGEYRELSEVGEQP